MKESEGSAMKKDIEWLKEKAQKRIDKLPRTYSGLYIEGSRDAYDLALQYINQLDEPEVLSQEWIDEHAVAVAYDGIPDQSEIVYVDDLENLVIPQQELPVVPKYVDEWIRKHRGVFDLYPALRTLENNTLGWKLTYKWYRTNTRKFVNAYLTGAHEVEEEQKYYVINHENYFLLAKDKWDGFIFSTGGNSRLGGPVNSSATFELTEQEIKDYDPRYWAFRKPIDKTVNE